MGTWIDLQLKSESDKRSRWKLKMDILRHYSGNNAPECAWCSESDVRVLCIDHINGGGREHRKSLVGFSSNKFYYYLRSQGFPPGYQVLCMNCNTRKRYEEYNLYCEEV